MSSKTIFKESNATVCISIEEFEHLIACEKELIAVKNIIGEMIGSGPE